MSRREDLIKKLKQGIPSSFTIKDQGTRKYCESLREIVLQLISDLYAEEDPPIRRKKFEEAAKESEKKNDSKNSSTSSKFSYKGEMSVEVSEDTITLKNDSESPSSNSVYSVTGEGERSWNDIVDVLNVSGSIIKGTDDSLGGSKTIFLQGDEDIEVSSSGKYLYTFGGAGVRKWENVDDVIVSGEYVKLEAKNGEYKLGLKNEDIVKTSDLFFGNRVFTTEGWREFAKLSGWCDKYEAKKDGHIKIVLSRKPTEGSNWAEYEVSLDGGTGSGSYSFVSDKIYTEEGWKTLPKLNNVIVKGDGKGIEVTSEPGLNKETDIVYTISLKDGGAGPGGGVDFEAVGSIELVDGGAASPENPNPPKRKLQLRGDSGDPAGTAVYFRDGNSRSWEPSSEISVVTDVLYNPTTHEFVKKIKKFNVFGVNISNSQEEEFSVFKSTPHWKEHTRQEATE